tara:strand:- start:1450 stop:1554 length:105 start_codon:yes stop_codon:yes gene_type:complete
MRYFDVLNLLLENEEILLEEFSIINTDYQPYLFL